MLTGSASGNRQPGPPDEILNLRWTVAVEECVRELLAADRAAANHGIDLRLHDDVQRSLETAHDMLRSASWSVSLL